TIPQIAVQIRQKLLTVRASRSAIRTSVRQSAHAILTGPSFDVDINAAIDREAPARADPGERVVLDVGSSRAPPHPTLHGLRHVRAPAGAHLPELPEPTLGTGAG